MCPTTHKFPRKTALYGSASPHRLFDNHGREINYLRLALTDRCNLRCRYCLPEKGVSFIPHEEILSFEEFARIVTIFSALGIIKVRVTGGEPFARRGCISFLQQLKKISGVEHLHVTTNGVETGKYLDDLVDLGLAGMNLSLDTLDERRFWSITHRDYHGLVMKTLHGALERGLPLKVNSVVLDDTTDAEIIRLVGLSKKYPLTLRFIEIMPFSGQTRSKKIVSGNLWQRLKGIFPAMEESKALAPTTARLFSLPGHQGKIGVIEGYSRLFCQTCNKVRVTPVGMLKTCLYDNGVLDLKRMLRSGARDTEIQQAIVNCINNRFVNGHAAELFANRISEPSMSQIGG